MMICINPELVEQAASSINSAAINILDSGTDIKGTAVQVEQGFNAISAETLQTTISKMGHIVESLGRAIEATSNVLTTIATNARNTEQAIVNNINSLRK